MESDLVRAIFFHDIKAQRAWRQPQRTSRRTRPLAVADRRDTT